MNILFLTLVEINSIDERGIYQDLLRKFRNENHDVTIVTPVERHRQITTNYRQKEGISILQVKTFNIQKTNVLEKGIATLAIEYQYLSAIKKYTSDKKFDLVLYSTPPITFSKIIEFVKNRDSAKSYLLLKDIFPQNAVDMGMMKEGSFLHNFFIKKEKKLYQVSDVIGCMSSANLNFILKHNPEISKDKVEVNPNTIEPILLNYSDLQKKEIRKKYRLPIDKKILVYGGNLGKPQGINFLLETIKATVAADVFFLVVGSGTEYLRIDRWFKENSPDNAVLLAGLPKEDYDLLLNACDVGLIFLHKDFTIPNFPSRLLSYLEMEMPIIAATDPNTDIGSVIEESNCGRWVISGDMEGMQKAIEYLISDEKTYREMKKNARLLLERDYKVERSYNLIKDKIHV